MDNNNVEVLPKVGAPVLYNPSMCETIVQAAAEGKHVAGMILSIGIKSRSTWYEWQKKYPEFKEAVEYAKLISMSLYEDIGLKGALGKIEGFNASTYAIIMNNKFPEEYNRSGTGSSGNTNITFNTVNLSDSEKMERIKGLSQKLLKAGIVLDNGSNQDENI